MLKEEVAPNFDKLLIIRLVLQEDSSNFAKPQDFQQEQCVHIGPIEHSGENSSNFAKPNREPVGHFSVQAHRARTSGLASTSCPTDRYGTMYNRGYVMDGQTTDDD